ncbi:hypothetical protein AAG570_000803 [Ranatra chinensis]|uniref:Tubulin/FtsZ GTPase domain-containing protein n=1 Tax=Ranatra chinensis TaxID=642074 RepID=A0ABD0YYF5_9HEMI
MCLSCFLVGQCGNQIGSVLWPLILKEYGLLQQESDKKQPFKKVQEDAIHSFFYQVPEKTISCSLDFKKSNLKARALLIDMEESVVQRFQTGPLRDLFDNACSLTNYPGSGNNWAVGYFTHGGEQKSIIKEMLRSAAEKCDRLHCFLQVFSLGGGTGSGLGSAILPLLEEQFPKVDRVAVCVHPGVNNDVVTSPYNIAFSMKKLVEYASCVFPLDNKAILDICDRLGAPAELKTWSPYKNINSVIAKMLLALTSGARFPGTLNLDISDIATNMVPFYRLNFLSSSLFPIKLPKANGFRIMNRESEQIFRVCAKENQLLRIDPMKGRLFGATLLSRSKAPLSDLRQNIERYFCSILFLLILYSALRFSLSPHTVIRTHGPYTWPHCKVFANIGSVSIIH